mmetsp:Transcript_8601/g.36014  ORF Transcript_8601/g.36014 Transcript_8601/m.36014 type:complete len:242 (+) Transcript_8601:457-1182(+)
MSRMPGGVRPLSSMSSTSRYDAGCGGSAGVEGGEEPWPFAGVFESPAGDASDARLFPALGGTTTSGNEDTKRTPPPLDASSESCSGDAEPPRTDASSPKENASARMRGVLSSLTSGGVRAESPSKRVARAVCDTALALAETSGEDASIALMAASSRRTPADGSKPSGVASEPSGPPKLSLSFAMRASRTALATTDSSSRRRSRFAASTAVDTSSAVSDGGGGAAKSRARSAAAARSLAAFS